MSELKKTLIFVVGAAAVALLAWLTAPSQPVPDAFADRGERYENDNQADEQRTGHHGSSRGRSRARLLLIRKERSSGASSGSTNPGLRWKRAYCLAEGPIETEKRE